MNNSHLPIVQSDDKNSSSPILDSESINHTNTFFQAFMDNLDTPAFCLDTEFRYTFFNQTHIQQMKNLYNADIRIGECHLNYIYIKEDRERAKQNLEKALSGEEVIVREYSGDHLLSRQYCEVHHKPMKNSDGAIIGISVLVRNITDMAFILEKLYSSEENARALINAPNESVFMMEPEGTILYVNETMASRLGYTVEEMVGKSTYHFVTPDVAMRRKTYVDELLRTKKPIHVLDERNGRVIENNLYPVLNSSGEVTRIAIYGRDVTKQKETERELRESEEKYRTVVEKTHEGIVIALGSSLVFANEAFAKMSGYSTDELIGMDYLDFVPEEKREEMVKKFETRYADDTAPHKYEFELLKKDKSLFIVEISAGLIEFKGKPADLVVMRDISPRKRAEEIQTRTISLLNQTQAITKLGGWDYNLITKEIQWTDEVYKILGAKPDFLPMDIEHAFDLYSPEDAPIIKAAYNKAVTEAIPYDIELKFFRFDGTPIWVRTIGNPVLENGQVVRVTGIIMDITERKQMESSLREVIQKLRLLTRITRHDIVNGINVINLYLEILRETEDPDERQKYIQKTLDASTILEKTIGFTQEYENLGSVSSRWLSLFSITNSAISTVSMKGVRVLIDIPVEIEIYSDPIISRVFSTLLDNSLRHGEKTSEIRIFTKEDNNNLIIFYEDNGVGIENEEKESIFKHGYGKNTGIGLFLAREILSITGMQIKETGVTGGGARFQIRVPQGVYRINPAEIRV